MKQEFDVERNMLAEDMTLKEIIAQGKEIVVIRALLWELERETERLYRENSHYSACLRAIRKINNAKNEAIDALCEIREE